MSPMLYLHFPAFDHTAECGHYQKPQPWRAPWCIFTLQNLITRHGVDIIKEHNPEEPHVVSLLSSMRSHGVVWTLSKTTTLTSPMLYLYIPASDHSAECGNYPKPQPWRAPWCIFNFQHLMLPGLHTTLLRSMQSGSSGLQSRTRLRLYMPTLITRALRSTAWQSRCDFRTRTSVVKCLSGTIRVNFALMTLRGWRPG